jgi:hypothetical protein
MEGVTKNSSLLSILKLAKALKIFLYIILVHRLKKRVENTHFVRYYAV